MNIFKNDRGSVLATGAVIAVIALIVGSIGAAIANRKVNDPTTIEKGKVMLEQAQKEQVQKRKIKEESKGTSDVPAIDIGSLLDKADPNAKKEIAKEVTAEGIVVHIAYNNLLIINDSGALYFIESSDLKDYAPQEGDSIKITYNGKKEKYKDMKVVGFNNILKGEKVDESEALNKEGTPIKIKSFLGDKAWVCTNIKTKKDAIYVFSNFNNIVADVLREGDTLVIRAQNASENDALKYSEIKTIVKN